MSRTDRIIKTPLNQLNFSNRTSKIRPTLRKRGALNCTSNMLAHRFAHCSYGAMINLCKLLPNALLDRLVDQMHYKSVAQYNNGLRVLLGLPRCCMFADAWTDDFYNSSFLSIIECVADSIAFRKCLMIK